MPTITVGNVLLWIPVMLLAPTGAGYAVCRFLSLRPGLPRAYLVGCFTEWAFFQLISVPLTLVNAPFSTVIIPVTVFLVGLCAFALWDWLRSVTGNRHMLRPRRERQPWTGA